MPAISGGICFILLTLTFLATAGLYTAGLQQIMAFIALAICLFVSGTIVPEFYRGMLSRGTQSGRLS